MFDLLSPEAKGRRDRGFYYTLEGDLGQMSAQKRFLQEHNFEVGQVDVYPALRTEEEFHEAVRLIWRYKVDGWWHYKKVLIELGECTAEEFDAALDVAVAAERGR